MTGKCMIQWNVELSGKMLEVLEVVESMETVCLRLQRVNAHARGRIQWIRRSHQLLYSEKGNLCAGTGLRKRIYNWLTAFDDNEGNYRLTENIDVAGFQDRQCAFIPYVENAQIRNLTFENVILGKTDANTPIIWESSANRCIYILRLYTIRIIRRIWPAGTRYEGRGKELSELSDYERSGL